ncbi:MAG: HAMP domain-containing sensor histidine kinase [Syntrophomonas sp.]
MDIKWKKYSHATITKIIVFLTAIIFFTGAITILWNTLRLHNNDFSIAFEDSYYLSSGYINDSSDIINSLRKITEDYKSEQFVLSGSTVTEDEIRSETDVLFEDFVNNSKNYNPNLSTEENHAIFNEVYADKIALIKDRLIQDDLRDYNSTLRKLEQYHGLIYYAKDGETVFTNSPNPAKDYFKTYPSYITLAGFEQDVFPQEIKTNTNYEWLQSSIDQLNQQDVVYIAFSEGLLHSRITKWQADKKLVANSMNQMAGLILGFIITFIYLIWITGRRPQEDEKVHLNYIDRIYNDLNIFICGLLIAAEAGVMVLLNHLKLSQYIFPVTFLIASLGMILVLALVKHLKNKTFISHSLMYVISYKLYAFIRDIYNSGSVALKVMLVVIIYPIIASLGFIMLPITILAACWIALKKVKEFNVITEGVKLVKEGNINHTIDIPGDGEFAQLAVDINHITDGLSQAVENEVKSERLKSELITNVSHDIRTPLTAIITYVDLLKNETDHNKAQEFIGIIDQKAQRLKVLTDDLFEAAKASSGDLPVNYEIIDIISLITQGLGELDDKIQARKLEFKIAHPQDKIFIRADGKLLWRAVENLLSNIFKYAQEGSRVYINIDDLDGEARLTIKNISAYELNVSAEELMERFKRGDESRSSQGSGLGLSIAKSLVEIQGGSFRIEIDGDLFKVTIQMASAE